MGESERGVYQCGFGLGSSTQSAAIYTMMEVDSARSHLTSKVLFSLRPGMYFLK